MSKKKQDRLCKQERKLVTVLNCGRLQAQAEAEWKCRGCEHQGDSRAVGQFDRWCKQFAKEFPPGVNPYFCIRKGSDNGNS